LFTFRRDEIIRKIGPACYRRHGKQPLARPDDKILNLTHLALHRLRWVAGFRIEA